MLIFFRDSIWYCFYNSMIQGYQNLIFDIEIPFEEKRTNKEISSLVENEIKKLDNAYFAVISIDRV